jgi:ketosteroid isomerase-like protein
MHKFILNLAFCLSCLSITAQQTAQQKEANTALDQWHKAAANADFTTYFNLMTVDAVFIGTDATENWDVEEFKTYSKPYFDQGKAWSFTAIERHLYETQNIIYFDELLDTQMGICRGSGVLKKENGVWKIAHYVLSIAVPNDQVSTLTALKKEWDASYIKELSKK